MSERDDDYPAPDEPGSAEPLEASGDVTGEEGGLAAEAEADASAADDETASDETAADKAVLVEEAADDAEPAEALNEAELNEMIEQLCNSKADEFRMLGYEHVTGREVWDCIAEKYQKKGFPPLHQIVNDILSLKSTQFMNWMTMSIYKNAQF